MRRELRRNVRARQLRNTRRYSRASIPNPLREVSLQVNNVIINCGREHERERTVKDHKPARFRSVSLQVSISALVD